ncbi:MAG: patatin-like phospholipase family protein, partial [Vicinamibacteria bacterium]
MTRSLYSPERPTALVLSGTGADGAYHAGVLRALHEAGVKIDLVAGRGMGAASAVFAAVDGGARLWEAGGVWRTTDAGQTWHNISDQYFKVGSMGDIDVADSDPKVIYAGTG